MTVPAMLSLRDCADLEQLLSGLMVKGVGTRQLLDFPWCMELAAFVRAHPMITAVLPADPVAVQCTFFEKSLGQNWLVPLHQDLSIPVAAKVDHLEFTGWSEKEGGHFVQPPMSVLQQLVAVRLHIDACGVDDGPLKVVPGSHKQGRVPLSEALAERDRLGEIPCLVEKGGALVMRPLLLHASSKASGNSKRRVLHFVYGPRTLPYGLGWRNAV